MKTLLIYAAGFATPFAIWAIVCAIEVFQDWKKHRRYKRAWDKFSAEFDNLPALQLSLLKAKWDQEPWRFAHYCDDRARYFADRWQHGHTTEA